MGEPPLKKAAGIKIPALHSGMRWWIPNGQVCTSAPVIKKASPWGGFSQKQAPGVLGFRAADGDPGDIVTALDPDLMRQGQGRLVLALDVGVGEPAALEDGPDHPVGNLLGQSRAAIRPTGVNVAQIG